MTYTIALCRLSSPNLYSPLQLREAALYILRLGRWAAREDVLKAKRVLKGDIARQQSVSPARWAEIQRLRAAAKSRGQAA